MCVGGAGSSGGEALKRKEDICIAVAVAEYFSFRRKEKEEEKKRDHKSFG